MTHHTLKIETITYMFNKPDYVQWKKNYKQSLDAEKKVFRKRIHLNILEKYLNCTLWIVQW